MMLGVDWNRVGAIGQLSAVVLLGLFAAGCGGESAEQAIERRKKQYNEQPQILAQFSGQVTIDGAPPAVASDHALIVLLYDPKQPPAPGRSPRHVTCQADGSFRFTDGVAPGSYVVLFAILKRGHPGSYRGPDLLQNRYNDPDKNAEKPEFKLDLSSPGKTDQVFKLEVAGKDPIQAPGAHAVTKLQR